MSMVRTMSQSIPETQAILASAVPQHIFRIQSQLLYFTYRIELNTVQISQCLHRFLRLNVVFRMSKLLWKSCSSGYNELELQGRMQMATGSKAWKNGCRICISRPRDNTLAAWLTHADRRGKRGLGCREHTLHTSLGKTGELNPAKSGGRRLNGLCRRPWRYRDEYWLFEKTMDSNPDIDGHDSRSLLQFPFLPQILDPKLTRLGV